jgi:hypothetical protein
MTARSVLVACLLSAGLWGVSAARAQDAVDEAAPATEAPATEPTATEPTATEPTEPTATEPTATEAASPVAGRGGELDPNARPAPAYGSREAVRQSETAALRRAGDPDPDDPSLPVGLSFFASLGAVMDSSYDQAVQSLAFGPPSPNLAFDGSLTHAVVPWLHLGGRLGVRGRGWLRRDGEFGMATGIDAMAIAHFRFHVGTVVELGAVLGGGLGLGGVTLRSATVLGVAPRLHGAVQIGFRLARGFHVHVRGAWDYFPWNDIDAGGRDLDLGGPFVGLGIEVKT